MEFIGPVSVAEQGDDPSATAIVDDSPVDRRHKTNWARLIRKVYEVDPLKCLNCSATMRIIAMIYDPICMGISLSDECPLLAESGQSFR